MEESIMFGYARCSTQHQDAIYEINELVKLGVKRENIYIDFNIWIPPEIPAERLGYFVYKGSKPFDICIRYPNRYPF